MSIHPHTPRVAPATAASDFSAHTIATRVAAPEDAPVAAPVALADDPTPPELDAHGFDPADYQWVPVKRKPRADGWSNEKQRAFIGALADQGSVSRAAQSVGMTEQGAYKLRRSPGAESFARAWDAAIVEAGKRLLDIAIERATLGEEQVVLDKEGQVIAIRRKASDRLLMFLLRTRLGDRLGLLADAGAPPEAAATLPAHPALPSVADAMIALEPVVPDAPHETMSADELDDAIALADVGDGVLPHWLADAPVPPVRRGPNGLPVGPRNGNAPSAPPSATFERFVAEARREDAMVAHKKSGAGLNFAKLSQPSEKLRRPKLH